MSYWHWARGSALQRYEEGQKGALELVETDRSNALWRTDLAFSYQKIGHVRLAQDDAQRRSSTTAAIWRSCSI